MTLASPKPVTVIAPTATGSAGRWYEDAIIY